MNGKDTRNEQLEKLLGKARLHDPSPLLRERVTTKAKKTWNEAPPEVPWWIPARRLVASVAAAVLVIWLANVSSDCSVARWRNGGFSSTRQLSSGSEVLPDLPYAPFVRNLASVNRKLPATDTSGLQDYMEAARQLLNESRENEPSVSPVPAGSRSRWLPKGSNVHSYS